MFAANVSPVAAVGVAEIRRVRRHRALPVRRFFRALVSDTLDELGAALGCSAETILKVFDKKVNQFFVQSLQLDVHTMRLEHE